MNEIVWLASYPKSGNTWLRVFLTNLQRDSDRPADINELNATPIASARGIFDDAVGVEASELTPHEVHALRPEVYAALARQAVAPVFLKVHDANSSIGGYAGLVPSNVSSRVIYVIRNPLDLVISLADHLGLELATAISNLGDRDFHLARSKHGFHRQLEQHVDSWSCHVESWVDSGLKVHVIRYEDMLDDPERVFASVAEFAGCQCDRQRIDMAIRFSDFTEMKRQEERHGFKERSAKSSAFFKRGGCGYWETTLTQDQVSMIVSDHYAVMSRFEYL
jgi:Sulfotransferase domain